MEKRNPSVDHNFNKSTDANFNKFEPGTLNRTGNHSTIDKLGTKTASLGFGLQKGNLMANQHNQSTISYGKGLDALANKAKGNMHQTLDVEEDKAQSVADNVSAGGTRYIVGLKGGLKFYG